MLVLGPLGQLAPQQENFESSSFDSYVNAGWYPNAAAAVVVDNG
jgi:hypothetical protein